MIVMERTVCHHFDIYLFFLDFYFGYTPGPGSPFCNGEVNAVVVHFYVFIALIAVAVISTKSFAK